MNGKFGLKAFGLSILAVLGMMAFGAVGAQAQEEHLKEPKNLTGLFLLLHPGKSFEEEKVTEVTATGVQIGAGRLIVPERKIIIGCTSAHISEGKITLEVAHAKFLFLGCTVWTLVQHGGEHVYLLGVASPCHITNLEITANAKIRAILHGPVGKEEVFLLAEPLTAGGPFSIFTFLSGTGCPLPLTTEVKGSVGALIEQLNVALQILKLTPLIQLLLGDKLFYGTFASYIEATGHASLTGPGSFAGAAFGAH